MAEHEQGRGMTTAAWLNDCPCRKDSSTGLPMLFIHSPSCERERSKYSAGGARGTETSNSRGALPSRIIKKHPRPDRRS